MSEREIIELAEAIIFVVVVCAPLAYWSVGSWGQE